VPLKSVSSDPLVVIDPLNAHNNTTRSAFRFAEIQELFRVSHQILQQNLLLFRQSPSQQATEVLTAILAGSPHEQ